MKCIIGTKQGMTQIFREDGTVVPVTRVHAGPCTVTQVKTKEHDGVQSIQVGYGEQAPFRVARAQQGHLSGLPTVRTMKEFRISNSDTHLERGMTITVQTFATGDKVKVTGTSKGKGFQGVVKRHGFKGANATHGTKDQVRMPGSIGATGPARVFKGTRMGGQMGNEQVTVSNLEIVGIDPETNELFIKGAVPGPKGGSLYIYSEEGTIEPTVVTTAVTEESTNDVVTSTDETSVDTVVANTEESSQTDTEALAVEPAPSADTTEENTQA